MVKQIDVKVGPFWWGEGRNFPGGKANPIEHHVGTQRSYGRVVNTFNAIIAGDPNHPIKRHLRWGYDKNGFTIAPESAYIRDGENFHDPCPHASQKNYVGNYQYVEGNPIHGTLRCDYPAYSPHHNSDQDTYNRIKSVTTTPAAQQYKTYYEESCRNQQEALERTGNTFGAGNSGTDCVSNKGHAIGMCKQIGMPLDQCHYGSFNTYRDLCNKDGAKNGQFNVVNGKYVFSFEHGFNPHGARGICTDPGALKAYWDRKEKSGLNNPITGGVIAGNSLASMNELHKRCELTQTINGQTGEIKHEPLRGVNCTHNALVDMEKSFKFNKSAWEIQEKNRITKEEQDKRIAEQDRLNAERLEKLAKQQAAAQEAQRKEAARLAKAGEEANKLIAQSLTKPSTGTTTNKAKKPIKKKKKLPIAKIAAVVILLLIIVGVFLFMPGSTKSNVKNTVNLKK